MKTILLIFLSVSFCYSQVQIGQDINGVAAGDTFGTSTSINASGNIVAISAPLNNDNGTSSGHVRIFENQSGSWVQLGNTILGEVAGDKCGSSISLSSDGTIIAIGSSLNDDNGTSSGHVRVFENQSGVWTQIGSDIDGEAPEDQSGGTVSLSSNGNILAIGYNSNDGNGPDSGHVRIYENQNGVWVQIG